MTLSCVDLQWNKLISIFAQMNGENLDDNDMDKIDFFERCTYLNYSHFYLLVIFRMELKCFLKLLLLMDHWAKLGNMQSELNFRYIEVHMYTPSCELCMLQF